MALDADDSQLYKATALQELTFCIQDIMTWNVSNILKCNPKKTEIIHFSRFSPADPVPSIKVLLRVMKSKTLGSHLTAISPETHINNICRSAYHSIHHIGKTKNFLSRSATERLIHAFFSSKLDYCNSILPGLPSYELEKLQRLQNAAPRLTVRAKTSAHITPVLKS